MSGNRGNRAWPAASAVAATLAEYRATSAPEIAAPSAAGVLATWPLLGWDAAFRASCAVAHAVLPSVAVRQTRVRVVPSADAVWRNTFPPTMLSMR